MVQVWKIAPGEGAEDWDLFREHGCIGLGWLVDSDYRDYRSEDEVLAALEAERGKDVPGYGAGAAKMVQLLETDHLDDQLAALEWLRKQPFVDQRRIAVAGNSFGGIETILGAEREGYCAAIDSAGGAESWALAPALQDWMKRAVQNAKAPIFFFQAENDWNLSPSQVLSAVMKAAGKPFEVKIYPPFGRSRQEGHSFGYFGSAVWEDDVFRFLNRHCVAP